jgi:hypothetical protein
VIGVDEVQLPVSRQAHQLAIEPLRQRRAGRNRVPVQIAPRTGSLLIAPTAFTHTHRGNRPQGGDTFIATRWILFQSAYKMYGGG